MKIFYIGLIVVLIAGCAGAVLQNPSCVIGCSADNESTMTTTEPSKKQRK